MIRTRGARSRVVILPAALATICMTGVAVAAVATTAMPSPVARLANRAPPVHVTAKWPASVEAGRVLAVHVTIAEATPGLTAHLDRRVGARWVPTSAASLQSGRAVLRWRVAGALPLHLRVSVWKGRRVVAASGSRLVLVSVSGQVLPNKATTISAEGYSLTVPAGTVTTPTTATVTPLDPSSAGLPGPSVRLHINAHWNGTQSPVRVTLPVDPDVGILGSDYAPVLVHFYDHGGGQILVGQSIRVADGEVSYETPSLSIFTSFSLPKISLASVKQHAALDLANWLGSDLSTFLGQHTSAPSCSPDSSSWPGVATDGSAFADAEAIDYQPALKYCVSVDGSTATWTLANNTGTVLAVDIDSGAPNSAVKIGALTSSGNPLLDYVFGKMNPALNAGANGDPPTLIALPPGGGVKVSVAVSSSASLTVDESPLGTFGAFILSEIGEGAEAAGDVYNALVQCGYSPVKTGLSELSLLQCLDSSAGLIKAGPKALDAVGKILIVVAAGITVKQALGIGHRTGSLAYSGQKSTGPSGAPGSGSGGPGSGGSGPGGPGPSSPTPLPPAQAVSANSVTTCALLLGGQAACWGVGQWLSSQNDGGDSAYPTLMPGISDATAIATGAGYACALRSGGSVACWGDNGVGELGDGTTASTSTPVTVLGITDAVQVAAGENTACALLRGGAVDCWGENGYGELGNGTTTGPQTCASGNACSTTPLQVPGIATATQVSAGFGEACAVLEAGAVDCWGDNGFGSLGTGTTSGGASTPVHVSGVTDAVEVSAGDFFACAVTKTGTVNCWGDNYDGELGTGTTTGRNGVVVDVSGITTASQVAAGNGHVCALLNGGGVDCWGDNVYGELGDGVTVGPQTCGSGASTFSCSTTPVPVVGISEAIGVAAGTEQSCALLTGGQIVCWGADEFGELGDGTTTDSSRPVVVVGIQ